MEEGAFMLCSARTRFFYVALVEPKNRHVCVAYIQFPSEISIVFSIQGVTLSSELFFVANTF